MPSREDPGRRTRRARSPRPSPRGPPARTCARRCRTRRTMAATSRRGPCRRPENERHGSGPGSDRHAAHGRRGSAPPTTIATGLTLSGSRAGSPQPPSRQAMREPATATGETIRAGEQVATSRSGPRRADHDPARLEPLVAVGLQAECERVRRRRERELVVVVVERRAEDRLRGRAGSKALEHQARFWGGTRATTSASPLNASARISPRTGVTVAASDAWTPAIASSATARGKATRSMERDPSPIAFAAPAIADRARARARP